jgi:hypothetical protein
MSPDRVLRLLSFAKRINFRPLYGPIYVCNWLAVICDSTLELINDELHWMSWLLVK